MQEMSISSVETMARTERKTMSTKWDYEIGKQYHRWTIMGIIGKCPGDVAVAARCECGTEKTARLYQLRDGISKSCGCFRKEVFVTHGRSRTNDRTYRSWTHMVQRCTNPDVDCWENYGGRGITVCERWLNSFSNFLADMGPRPSLEHSIERIENDGNYEPGNCAWATKKEQCNNTRFNRWIVIDGERKTIAQWCEARGVPRRLVYERLFRGWPLNESILAPPQPQFQRFG